jgi:hypothetical protein
MQVCRVYQHSLDHQVHAYGVVVLGTLYNVGKNMKWKFGPRRIAFRKYLARATGKLARHSGNIVPECAVVQVKTSTRTRAIVWWYLVQGHTRLRCFPYRCREETLQNREASQRLLHLR